MAKLCVEADIDNNTIDFDKEVERFKQRLESYIEDVGTFEVVRNSHECDYREGMHYIYRAAMEMGTSHPKGLVDQIREAHARFGEPWFCRAEGCTNQNRYTSGYCGIHDITFNEGKGERRNYGEKDED